MEIEMKGNVARPLKNDSTRNTNKWNFLKTAERVTFLIALVFSATFFGLLLYSQMKKDDLELEEKVEFAYSCIASLGAAIASGFIGIIILTENRSQFKFVVEESVDSALEDENGHSSDSTLTGDETCERTQIITENEDFKTLAGRTAVKVCGSVRDLRDLASNAAIDVKTTSNHGNPTVETSEASKASVPELENGDSSAGKGHNDKDGKSSNDVDLRLRVTNKDKSSSQSQS